MIYKKITVITRRENLLPIREALVDIGIDGMTMTKVEGSGTQQGIMTYMEENEVKQRLMPKIQIEMMIKKELEDKVVSTVMELCNTGTVGDGKIFIERQKGSVLKIRTNDENELAL